MKKVNKFSLSLRASSLVEVITSMIIIGIVFSIAIIIYLRVQQSVYTERRVEADLLVREVIHKTLKENNFQSVEINFDEITIFQDVTDHQLSAALKVVRWEARDVHGKVLIEKKRIVHVEN